jgi:hypothetical protein
MVYVRGVYIRCYGPVYTWLWPTLKYQRLLNLVPLHHGLLSINLLKRKIAQTQDWHLEHVSQHFYMVACVQSWKFATIDDAYKQGWGHINRQLSDQHIGLDPNVVCVMFSCHLLRWEVSYPTIYTHWNQLFIRFLPSHHGKFSQKRQTSRCCMLHTGPVNLYTSQYYMYLLICILPYITLYITHSISQYYMYLLICILPYITLYITHLI